MATLLYTSFVVLIAISATARDLSLSNEFDPVIDTTELPEPLTESDIYYISSMDSNYEEQEARTNRKNISAIAKGDAAPSRVKNKKRKNSTLNEAVQVASLQGFNAMIDLYERKEPEILRKGQHIKTRWNNVDSDK